MELPATYRLVACLGNPGQQYENTRHNVGYLVADELARRSLVNFSFNPQWNADTAKVGGRTLMKPKTFMNLSGEAVGAFVRYFKIPSNHVIVVLDDISLPLGMVRLRKTGTAGGHNGLESVLVHLGTERIPRLRVGIGRPDLSTLHDHVLGTFDTAELAALAGSIHRASDAFEYANAHGMDAAMNQFNQRNQEP